MKFVDFFLKTPEGRVTLAQTVNADSCINCGEALQGAYCSACGQKKFLEKDFTLSHFFGTAVYNFTHFDSKFFRSLKYLLLKPGFLSTEYVAGRRKKYMNPVQLFVVINVLYFLFISLTGANTFTTPLDVQISSGPFHRITSSLINKKIAEEQVSYEMIREKFDHQVKAPAKTLIIVMIPIMACLLALLYFLQRRYFIEHLVFSLHFYSFLLILAGLGALLIGGVFYLAGLAIDKFGKAFANDQDSFITLGMGLLIFVFLFSSIKRFYKESNVLSFIKSLSVTFSLIFILVFYRFLLFLLTFYSLSL